MVDWHPSRKALSTEAEPRWTMLSSRGDDLPCHPVKNLICYFIIPNVLISYITSILQNYIDFTHRATFSLNVTRCYDVAKNAAAAAIGFSVRTVRAYIRACDIFLMSPSALALYKNRVTFNNVTRSIRPIRIAGN